MSENQIKSPFVKLNLVDRFVNRFFPSAGAKRVRAKMFLKTARNSGYIGASSKRTAGRGFLASGASSDVDDLGSLEKLRNRSRDLYRNTPLATAALKRINTNAIGSGLQLQCRLKSDVLGLSKEEAAKWEKDCESRFSSWAESKYCDITKTQNFYEMQGTVFLSYLMSGDIFTLTPLKKNKMIQSDLRLALYEGDFVENPNSRADTKEIAGGIKLDENGAPEAYFFRKSHPGGLTYDNKSVEIKAFGRKSGRRNVIHLFKRVRPGQRRGIPELAPVIEKLKQLGRYSDSELMAALLNSFYTVFIRQETQTEDGDIMQETIPAEDKILSDTAPGDDAKMELASGNVLELGTGEDVEFADPKRPNTGYDKFFTALVQEIAAALEIPYEQLLLHFTASYSASRGALMEAFKAYKIKRTFMAQNWCQLVFEEWLFQEIVAGRISAPGFLSDPYLRWAWTSSAWIGPGMGQIDPIKETKASILKIQNKLSDYETEYVESKGGDWESAMERLSIQTDVLKDMKLDTVSTSNISDPDSDTDNNTDPPPEE